jgi:hypothetical protein
MKQLSLGVPVLVAAPLLWGCPVYPQDYCSGYYGGDSTGAASGCAPGTFCSPQGSCIPVPAGSEADGGAAIDSGADVDVGADAGAAADGSVALDSATAGDATETSIPYGAACNGVCIDGSCL